MQTLTLNEEWYQFLLLNNVDIHYKKEEISSLPKNIPLSKNEIVNNENILNDYTLSISTQTKVLFLNIGIDIESVFWKVKIIEYWKPEIGSCRRCRC